MWDTSKVITAPCTNNPGSLFPFSWISCLAMDGYVPSLPGTTRCGPVPSSRRSRTRYCGTAPQSSCCQSGRSCLSANRGYVLYPAHDRSKLRPFPLLQRSAPLRDHACRKIVPFGLPAPGGVLPHPAHFDLNVMLPFFASVIIE